MSKLKGIPPWEQYIEFAVLGTVSLIAVVFITLQFIGQPNAAEIRGKGQVAPHQIDDLLRQDAERLRADLDPQAPPRIDLPDHQPLYAAVVTALESPVSPIREIQIVDSRPPLGTAEGPPEDAVFVEPNVPTPTLIVAEQFFDGLTSVAVEEHEELRDLVDGEPYDVTWATVAAVFPSDDWLRSLQVPGPDDDRASVPQSWHRDRATIVDVRVEREEYVNGGWTNRKTLDPIPGQFHLREELAGEIDARKRESLLSELRTPSIQRELIQPSFFPTRMDTWTPPDPYAVDDPEALDDEQRRIRQLRRRLSQLEQQREQLERDIDSPPAPGGPGAPAPGRGGGGGASPGLGSGGGASPGLGSGGGASPGVGGGRGGGGTLRPGASDRLKRDLERIMEQIESIREELKELTGEDVDLEQLDIEDADQILVWAHDLAINPGSIYRYRVVVDLFNPFYGRMRNLVEEQQYLAESFTMSSEASSWSEPLQARPPVHTFITRAFAPGQDRVAGQQIDIGSVVAEVYRFYDGRWWEERFRVDAGQQIGEVKDVRRERDGEDETIQIDFSTEWYVLDVIRDLDAEREDGRAAFVVMQNMIDGQTIEVRHPVQDAANRLRQELRDAIELIAAR